MIRDQQQVSSGRPFFRTCRLVPCTARSTRRRSTSSDTGAVRRGWDVAAAETFERSRQLGHRPADNELPPRNPGVKPVDDYWMPAPTVTPAMEVFAGMVDHTDAQIGRLIAALRTGRLDDTVVMVLSDNGASQKACSTAATNTERFRNLDAETRRRAVADIDRSRRPATDPHYAMGGRWRATAPFRRCKRDTHRGGNTDPLIVHWPGGRRPWGASTPVHHIDRPVPDAAGAGRAAGARGGERHRSRSRSRATASPRPSPAAERTEVRTTQYYEMLGSRAIYHDGLDGGHLAQTGTDWRRRPWELYDQRTDYTQAWDLADAQPAKLAELIELWWDEARRHNVLPLDDRGRDRFIDPTRPAASETRDVYRYFPDSSPIPSPSLPVILNCPHSFTVRFRLDDPDDAGLLVSHGGSLAGWALFVRDRKVTYINNNLKLSLTKLSTGELPVGQGSVRLLRVGSERSRHR